MLIKVYPLHLTFVLPDGSLKEGIFDQGLRIPDCLVILDIKAKLDYADNLNIGQLGFQNNQVIVISASAIPEPTPEPTSEPTPEPVVEEDPVVVEPDAPQE